MKKSNQCVALLLATAVVVDVADDDDVGADGVVSALIAIATRTDVPGG